MPVNTHTHTHTHTHKCDTDALGVDFISLRFSVNSWQTSIWLSIFVDVVKSKLVICTLIPNVFFLGSNSRNLLMAGAWKLRKGVFIFTGKISTVCTLGGKARGLCYALHSRPISASNLEHWFASGDSSPAPWGGLWIPSHQCWTNVPSTPTGSQLCTDPAQAVRLTLASAPTAVTEARGTRWGRRFFSTLDVQNLVKAAAMLSSLFLNCSALPARWKLKSWLLSNDLGLSCFMISSGLTWVPFLPSHELSVLCDLRKVPTLPGLQILYLWAGHNNKRNAHSVNLTA